MTWWQRTIQAVLILVIAFVGGGLLLLLAREVWRWVR